MSTTPAPAIFSATHPAESSPNEGASPVRPGVLLETLTWLEARAVLTPETVVVLPLGAAAKEHGPHLPLNNDFLIAEYLKHRILERASVVVAPTVNYHYYPAFVEYAGSSTLRLETARDLIVDVVQSLAAHGPRRFYVLNTGLSTRRPLAEAEKVLEAASLVLRYTDIGAVAAEAEAQVRTQPEGTHADEIETSMMLYIAPEVVNMALATRDFPAVRGRMTPKPEPAERSSPSGIYGDATLATREKGERVVEAMVEGILTDLAALARVPLP